MATSKKSVRGTTTTARRDLIWFTVTREEADEILAGLDPNGLLYAKLRVKVLESAQ